MNSEQLNQALQDCRIFHGTYGRNNIPLINRRPVAFILNTDSIEEPGEHWVALYLKKDGTCIYFDPFGLPPLHKDFIKYIKINSPNGVQYSSLSIQNILSPMCGLYCIEFVRAMNKRQSLPIFLNNFTKCTKCNDKNLINKVNQ